jgi:hypothetical protein
LVVHNTGVPDVEVARLGLGFTQVVLDLMKGGVTMVRSVASGRCPNRRAASGIALIVAVHG